MTPYYQDGSVTIYHGCAEDVLPQIESDSIDYCVTDPPYGIRKAEWDAAFPTFWMPDAARIARRALAIMPGVNNVLSCPREIPPFEYRWMLSVEITNGMTRGLMGFGNWIPVLVYGKEGVSLHRHQRDAGSIPIVGDMPDHPSPKPLRAMTWILSRFAPGSVIDPFMGSGTTLLAAKMDGRQAIGIEREEAYCEIAAERMRQQVISFDVEPITAEIEAPVASLFG